MDREHIRSLFSALVGDDIHNVGRPIRTSVSYTETESDGSLVRKQILVDRRGKSEIIVRIDCGIIRHLPRVFVCVTYTPNFNVIRLAMAVCRTKCAVFCKHGCVAVFEPGSEFLCAARAYVADKHRLHITEAAKFYALVGAERHIPYAII